MNSKHQLVLGAFFVVVLGILGYYTLFLTEFSLFREQHKLAVHFPDADGLREGDAVLVAGMRRGRVERLSYDPGADLARRITAVLNFEEELVLREGFAIQIRDATMLGGKLVAIDPGPADGARVPEDTSLFGDIESNALAGLGDLISESRGSFGRILEDVEAVTAELRAGSGLLGRLIHDEALSSDVSAGLTSASQTFVNLEEVTGKVRAGDGILGRLVADQALADELSATSTNLRGLTDDLRVAVADLREGRGTLGRLVNDPMLADDVSAAVTSLREITVKINTGEGSIGRLVSDPTAAQRIESILAKADSGEGLLAHLLTDEELPAKLDQVASDLATASNALRTGEGTLGKLVMDDALYRRLEQALNQVTLSLEEYREAAPITTFTSVLFGAF
jgi:phospholipid/cholesterol/gamma-HCH transport system substrate-binding protein